MGKYTNIFYLNFKLFRFTTRILLINSVNFEMVTFFSEYKEIIITYIAEVELIQSLQLFITKLQPKLRPHDNGCAML